MKQGNDADQVVKWSFASHRELSRVSGPNLCFCFDFDACHSLRWIAQRARRAQRGKEDNKEVISNVQ